MIGSGVPGQLMIGAAVADLHGHERVTTWASGSDSLARSETSKVRTPGPGVLPALSRTLSFRWASRP